MAKGQKASPRSEWAESTKQKQVQWQKLNRAKLSADLPKQEGDSFRALCKASGVSVSAALSVFVRACLQADSLDVIRDDYGTTAAGSIQDNDGRRDGDGRAGAPDFSDGRRDDPPSQKNIDPDLRQGDQTNGNDTPGTVDLPTANDTHGTV